MSNEKENTLLSVKSRMESVLPIEFEWNLTVSQWKNIQSIEIMIWVDCVAQN